MTKIIYYIFCFLFGFFGEEYITRFFNFININIFTPSLKHTKRIYWTLSCSHRFRVRFPNGRYSVRMDYFEASLRRDIFGGQLVVDYNKELLP